MGHEFQTTLKTIDLSIDGTEYVLTELTGSQRAKYLDLNQQKVKKNATGEPVGVTTHLGIESCLLTLCLKNKTTDQLVDEKTINSWPGTMLTEIFMLAVDLSSLRKESADDAKND